MGNGHLRADPDRMKDMMRIRCDVEGVLLLQSRTSGGGVGEFSRADDEAVLAALPPGLEKCVIERPRPSCLPTMPTQEITEQGLPKPRNS